MMLAAAGKWPLPRGGRLQFCPVRGNHGPARVSGAGIRIGQAAGRIVDGCRGGGRSHRLDGLCLPNDSHTAAAVAGMLAAGAAPPLCVSVTTPASTHRRDSDGLHRRSYHLFSNAPAETSTDFFVLPRRGRYRCDQQPVLHFSCCEAGATVRAGGCPVPPSISPLQRILVPSRVSASLVDEADAA